MKQHPRVIISSGEPAGIGPEIAIKIAQKEWPAELIVVGDPDLFLARAKLLNLPLTLKNWENSKTNSPHQPGSLYIIPQALPSPCEAGLLNKANAQYVIDCLTLATHHCLQKNCQALVTGPINKSIINEANIPFSGHTEFLANLCHSPHVLMLFVTPELKVALATTHLPLAKVPAAITTEKLLIAIRLLNNSLKNVFSINDPKILVTGLNPHAGENGHLGMEEIEIITPTIQQLKKEKMNIEGPFPADTIFTQEYLKNADAIFAMFHDQALPVVKYSGFNQAVNVTLGLPIIRTSVDHGTALDIAGKNKADEGSLSSAIQLALDLIKQSQSSSTHLRTVQ